MKKRKLFIVIPLIIVTAVSIGAIAFIMETNAIKDMQLNFVSGFKSQQSVTNPKESLGQLTSSDTSTTDSSPVETQDSSPSDGAAAIQADNSSGASKNADGITTGHLFEIYSEKDNVNEAIKEISLKFIEKQKDFYNDGYIEDGDDQRIEDVRLVGAALDDRYGEENYDNLVAGGSLSLYYINFEFKPKYPGKFVPMWALETLQDNGWVTMGGRELLIYHENNKLEAPYYLADYLLIDGFYDGESLKKVIEDTVRDEIPRLKLLNANNQPD